MQRCRSGGGAADGVFGVVEIAAVASGALLEAAMEGRELYGCGLEDQRAGSSTRRSQPKTSRAARAQTAIEGRSRSARCIDRSIDRDGHGCNNRSVRGLIAVIIANLAGCNACDSDDRIRPEPQPPAEQPGEPSFSAATSHGYDPDWTPRPKPKPPPGRDPLAGRWSLADATRPLDGGGELIATITTGMGELRCTLLADKAPQTVALFIGLANGTRPWRTIRGFAGVPAYDGSRFHRVLPKLLIAGGKP